MAAIAAGQQGVTVAIVEPGQHVGGMISVGLGKIDREFQENVMGSYARAFFRRVGKHYGTEISWTIAPKVAEATLRRRPTTTGRGDLRERPRSDSFPKGSA